MKNQFHFRFLFIVVIALLMIMMQSSAFAQAIAFYSGNVKNTDNQPIENVTVSASGANTETTISNGEFLLQFTELPNADSTEFTTITFEHSEYQTLYKNVMISEGDSLTNQEIILFPPTQTFNISGNVKFEDSQPVQYGEIAFLNVNGNVADNLYTSTDEQGNYSIEVPPGSYYIRSKALYREGAAWAYRYLYYDNALNLEDASILEINSDTSDINFIHRNLQAGSISGNVIDATNLSPVEGVEISTTSYPKLDSSFVGTDSNGDYTVDVFEGEYLLFAYKSGYELLFYNQATTIFDATPVVVSPDNLNVTGIDFSLPIEGTEGTNSISGFVYDADTGTPVPDVYVYALPLSTGGNGNSSLMKNGRSSGDGEILKTDNNGAYTLGKLSNGVYTIIFYRADYVSVFYGGTFSWETANVFNLTGNTNLTNININLVKMGGFGGEITGSVSTSAGGDTPTNILTSSLISVSNSSGDVVATAITDYNGDYIVPSVTNGIYTVKASHIGYVTTEYSQPVQIDLSNNPVVNNIDIGLESSPSSVADNNGQIPKSFDLYQNYPNPFNPTTKIEFDLANAQNVSLKIYDILGKEVVVLINDYMRAGNYSIEFDASNLTSGIYFYELKAGTFHQMRKMILLK